MEHETLLSNQGDARDRDNEDYDQEQGEKPHSKAGLLQRRSRSRVTEIGVCICFCIIGLVIGFSGGRITGSAVATSNGQELSYTNTCTKPAIRREWRSLSIAERDAYIDSVFCLRSKPSKLNANQTLYDDFAFVHYQFNDESTTYQSLMGKATCSANSTIQSISQRHSSRGTDTLSSSTTAHLLKSALTPTNFRM